MKITYEFDEKDLTTISDELQKAVSKDFNERYRRYWMSDKQSKEEMFRSAYEIAKYTAIANYLEDRIYTLNDQGCINLMTLVQLLKQKNGNIDNITSILYEEEMDYDTTMWANFDDLDTVVENYINDFNQ